MQYGGPLQVHAVMMIVFFHSFAFSFTVSEPRMASSECISEKPSTSFELTQDDIPGASLNEPFHSHTMAELHWWLLCRGMVVPTSWRKHQVVQIKGMT